MRQAGRDAADRVELLRPQQRLLELRLVGDVLHDRDGGDPPAGIVHGRDGDVSDHPRPVGVRPARSARGTSALADGADDLGQHPRRGRTPRELRADEAGRDLELAAKNAWNALFA